MSKWKEENFSFSCEFSWRICWLLSNKLMTFSDKWWFNIMRCSTCSCSSSICFFLRIRDLLADSLFENILLALLSSVARPPSMYTFSPFGFKWEWLLLLLMRVDMFSGTDCNWTWKSVFGRIAELKWWSSCSGTPSRMSKQWERWVPDSMYGFRCRILKLDSLWCRNKKHQKRERKRGRDRVRVSERSGKVLDAI